MADLVERVDVVHRVVADELEAVGEVALAEADEVGAAVADVRSELGIADENTRVEHRTDHGGLARLVCLGFVRADRGACRPGTLLLERLDDGRGGERHRREVMRGGRLDDVQRAQSVDDVLDRRVRGRTDVERAREPMACSMSSQPRAAGEWTWRISTSSA